MALPSLCCEKVGVVLPVLGKRLSAFVPILKYLQLDFSEQSVFLWHFNVQLLLAPFADLPDFAFSFKLK